MNANDVLRIIQEQTKQVVPKLKDLELKFDDKLLDLGVNSLERAQIIMQTLEILNLRISLIETVGLKNVEELTQLLVRRLANG